MINFKILTLFPNLFPGPLSESVTGIALEKNLWSCSAINIRDYSKDKHHRVDDMPYGGGAGMVLRSDVISDAINDVKSSKSKIIYLSPRGKRLTQNIARDLAKEQEIIMLCGRYEGVDQRVLDEFEIEELSIGDYVLSGGELAAYVVIDAILRNVTNVLGDANSLNEESFGGIIKGQYDNLLEYPQYTRPEIWQGRKVPDILLSGHHENIRKWRLEQAKKITQKNRPDLLSE